MLAHVLVAVDIPGKLAHGVDSLVPLFASLPLCAEKK
jgi:hypothetical protein